MQREALTSTDSDRFNKLLSPAVRPDHQREVCLLNEFVHGALERLEKDTIIAAGLVKALEELRP